MRRDCTRGVTLIELTISMFIAILILGSIFALFLQGRRNYERPRASMAIQEDMMRLVRWLSQDLTETNIQTVRSFPNAAQPGEPPGLSFESPRDAAQALQPLAPLGVVTWKKYVYYTLQPDPATPQVGHMVRREGNLSDQPFIPVGDTTHAMPLGSPLTPSAAPGVAAQNRTLAQNVLLANQTVAGFGSLDQHGGFNVSFGAGQAFDDRQRGLPIQVDLKLADVGAATGKVTVQTFQLLINPRN